MTKRPLALAAALVASAALSAPARAGFSPPTTLSGAGSRIPALAVDASGDGFVAWQDGSGQIEGAVRNTDGTFGTAINVSGTGNSDTKDTPSVGIDPQGNVTVAWSREASGSTLCGSFADCDVIEAAQMPAGQSAFGAPVELSLSTNGRFALSPRVVAVGQQLVYVAYQQGTGVFVNLRPGSPGGVFAAPINLNNSGVAAETGVVAAAAGGLTQITVAWDDANGGGSVRAATATVAGTFGSAQQVSPTAAGSFVETPAVAVDPSGNTIVVYSYSDNTFTGSDQAVEMAKRPFGSGHSYGTPVSLGTGSQSGAITAPQVSVDGAGHAAVVWTHDAGSGSTDVQAYVQTSGAPVTATLSTANADLFPFPVVASDATGDVVVAWGQGTTASTAPVEASELADGSSSFTSPQDVSSTNEQNQQATIGIDGSGGASVAWTDFGTDFLNPVIDASSQALRSTETDAGCPQQVVGTSATCSVSVTDTAAGTASAPAGTVSWSHSGGGTAGFSDGGSCQLQPDPSNAAISSCSIDYASPDANTATDQLAVSYVPSDGVHAASHGSPQAQVIAPPKATTDIPLSVSDNEIDLQGVIGDAEGLDTSYYFQYGPDLQDMVYDLPAYPGTDIGSTATFMNPVRVTARLLGLTPNTTYCYRLVAVNAAGTTYADDAGSGDPPTTHGLCQQTNGPPIAPQVVTGSGSVLSDGTLDFIGTVNPEGQPTKWFIQYSVYPDESYANGIKGRTIGGEVPVPDPGQDLGSAGDSPVPVGATVSGLTPGTTYWFRVVASNASGTTFGTSQAASPLTLQASETNEPRFELSGQGAVPGQQVSIVVTPHFSDGPTKGAPITVSATADSLGRFAISLAQGDFSGFVRGSYSAVVHEPAHFDASTGFTLSGRPLELLVSDTDKKTFKITVTHADPYAKVHLVVKPLFSSGPTHGDPIDLGSLRADRSGEIDLNVDRGKRFDPGGYILTATTVHEGDGSFAFRLTKQVVKRSPTYVALGDSYSSGVGTYTDNLDGNCRQSDDAYAPLLAAAKGWKLTFKACSGATVADVEHQLGSLGSGTGYVSLSVGGNDVGFGDVVKTCALPGPSHDSDCQNAIDHAKSIAERDLPKLLDTLYGKIADDAPNAKLVVLGYPHPFSAAGTICFPGAGFISQTEATELNAADDLLDAKIKAAADRHGFVFADPRAAFAGHDLCTPASKRWINGIDIGNQTESVHPTVAGQRAFLALVKDGLS
jgi:lysophospholipase L1-like esterase